MKSAFTIALLLFALLLAGSLPFSSAQNTEKPSPAKPATPDKDTKPGDEPTLEIPPEFLLKLSDLLNSPHDDVPVDLPDDVIVALADFKFENVKETPKTLDAGFAGKVTRVLAGSDKDDKLEFECIIPAANGPMRNVESFFDVKPDTRIQTWFIFDIEAAVRSGEAKNCIVVYQRDREGKLKIIMFDLRGIALAPAYEWLEATKNRKADRVPLSVIVLMDKAAPQELRKVAYRIVGFSSLAFKSRLEIIGKAVQIAANRDDTGYAALILSLPTFYMQLSENDKVPLIRYFLQGLTAAKDVRDANIWLGALSQDVQHIGPKDYPDLAKEILDALKKHEVTPAHDLANSVAIYNHLKKMISDYLEGKQPTPSPTPNDKPAPPAGNEAKIPSELRPIEAGLPDDAIVALVDLKVSVLKHDEHRLTWELKCAGNVKRFITGSDKAKGVEFVATVTSIGNGVDEQEYIGRELSPFIDSGECKDCLLVYERKADGSVNILRLQGRGLDFAPAYEWLENTKDRKQDCVPLSVMILMDKTATQQLRNLVYRTVAFSGLSFKSRFEILKNAIGLGVKRDDIAYGVWMLDILAFSKGMTKEDNIAVTRYFLEGLAASKDVRDANNWLSALAHDLGKMKAEDYPDLCKEIAGDVKKHEAAQAAPELRNDVDTYEKLKTIILERLAPKPPAPSPGEKPAPPADGGTKPPAPDKDAKPQTPWSTAGLRL